MANLTITKQSTTERHASASKHPFLGTADFSTPERADVGVASPAPDGVIRTASIYAYFGSGVGYRLVRVAIQERPDATVLAMVLPCGKIARIWNYGKRGVGVQVQSKSHPSVWYTVTAARCQCTRFHHQHQCSHQAAASEALAVWERWQQYSAVSAQKAVA